MKPRPIFDMAAVMLIVRDAGPNGIGIDELLKLSSGGIGIKNGLRHLKEIGAVCRVGPNEHYAATPDQASPPTYTPPKLSM